MLKAVIFDLDGTLYNDVPYIDQGFVAVARKIKKDFYLNSKQGAAVLKKMRNLYQVNDRVRIFNRVLEHFFPGFTPKEINAYVEKELLYFYKLYPRKVSLNAQAKDIFKYLRQRKVLIGLVTQGNPVDQTKKLFELKAMDLFDAIEISGHYPASKGKPDPFMFQRVLRRLKVSPKEAIYVGNDLIKDSGALKAGMVFYFLASSKDVKTPRAAGIRTIYQLSELKKEIK